MADKKISALTAATTPLAGTEVLPIVQSGSTVKVAVSDLTAGRAVSANGLTSTANVRVQYASAGNVSSVANNTASTAGSMSQLITTNDASRSLRVQYSSSGGAGGSALTNGVSTETAQIFTDGNYPIVLGTNVSAALILDTSQNAKIINNLVVGTAGKGIDFSANANAPGMTSEVLTWYEEGTWTGTLTGDVTGALTPVTVSGRYTRIGRQVTVQISFSNVNTTGAAGVLLITGLPFSSSAERSYGSCFFIGMGSAPATAYIQSSDNRISFLDAVTGAYINISAGAGKYVGAAITYTV